MQINNNMSSIKNQPSFGSMPALGKKVVNSNLLGKICDKLEFDGATMSFPAMLGLLYGATLLPRYAFADDKHDKREILVRDVTSITAILFGAKALSKGFSEICSKASGFVLNSKPENHTSFLKKAWNYLRPNKGVGVLGSEDIVKTYSEIDKLKGGLSEFCDSVVKGGGNLKKLFTKDKAVQKHVEDILGKTIKEAKDSKEIATALSAAQKAGHKAVQGIYDVFSKTDNVFVKKAKTLNSIFGAASILVLVPAFMIWIQKFNEKLTKKIVAKEIAAKAQNSAPKMNVSHTEGAKKAFEAFLK